MVERPTEQERTLIFGDWCLAELGDVVINFKKKEIIFRFRPSPKMRWKNQIPDTDFDQTTNTITKIYSYDSCFPVDPSPDFQTWVLTCDYYGNPADLVGMINKELSAKNESMKNEINIWKKTALLTQLDVLKAINFPEERRTKLIEQLKKQTEAMGSPFFSIPQKKGDAG